MGVEEENKRAEKDFNKYCMGGGMVGRVIHGNISGVVTASTVSAATLADSKATITGGDGGMRRYHCLLYTSPSPRDLSTSRMPSSA